MASRLDAIVIGAGVVGLAVARALALRGREVVILDAEPRFGMHASSRNSEVIHAGIYYPPGSLKARACVHGRERLYRYCAEHGIAHRRIGKLIVATHERERSTLLAIQDNARRSGVDDLAWLEAAAVAEREPELLAIAALWSPSTGIVDSHAFMATLLADAERHGATTVWNTRVHAIVSASPRVHVVTDALDVEAEVVVNAAGLGAPALFGTAHGTAPRPAPVKGSYFTLRGAAPFRTLVYPVPVGVGLGIHLTLDLAGRARFGPDQEPLPDGVIDYRVDPGRASVFEAAIRRYWPGLPADALEPAYAGIRAHTEPHGFAIEGPREHGTPGLVHLLGIGSPGLTSALALADDVLRALELDA